MARFLPAGLVLAATLSLALPGGARAHTPICACYADGETTVICEGGFSDGSSAKGVAMRVRDAAGATLIEGAMDANSEFTFERPAGFADVLFDGGEGHRIVIPASDIH